MKTKYLLIPVSMLLATGLIGCQIRAHRKAQPYYLEYWLNEASDRKEDDPNRPRGVIYLDNENNYKEFSDKTLTFRDKLQEVIKPLSPSAGEVDKEVKNTDGRYIMYEIRSYLGTFDACIMYINEDGILSTNAYAGGKGAPKAQHYVYDIGKDAAKEIIDYAVATYITQE